MTIMFRGNTVNYRLLALPLKSTPSFPRLLYLLPRKIHPIIIPPSWYPPPPPLAPIISTPLNSISSSPSVANKTRCERTLFFAFCSRVTSRDFPKWKAYRTKAFAFMCLRRARACVAVVSGFVAKWGYLRALDKKGQKSGSATRWNP